MKLRHFCAIVCFLSAQPGHVSPATAGVLTSAAEMQDGGFSLLAAVPMGLGLKMAVVMALLVLALERLRAGSTQR